MAKQYRVERVVQIGRQHLCLCPIVGSPVRAAKLTEPIARFDALRR